MHKHSPTCIAVWSASFQLSYVQSSSIFKHKGGFCFIPCQRSDLLAAGFQHTASPHCMVCACTLQPDLVGMPRRNNKRSVCRCEKAQAIAQVTNLEKVCL